MGIMEKKMENYYSIVVLLLVQMKVLVTTIVLKYMLFAARGREWNRAA